MYTREFLILSESGELIVHSATLIANPIVPATLQEREDMFNQALNNLQKEYYSEQDRLSDK